VLTVSLLQKLADNCDILKIDYQYFAKLSTRLGCLVCLFLLRA